MPPKRAVNPLPSEEPNRASKRVKTAPERFVPAPDPAPAPAPRSRKSVASKPVGRPSKASQAEPAKPKRKSTDKKETVSSPKRVSAAKPATRKALPVINHPPTEILDVFVMGEPANGELGLGSAKNAVKVKRPRLNAFLAASTVGVVCIATGGMHAAALTSDNQILTWGVNDQGACGRDTSWDGGLRDMDADSSSDSDEEDVPGLNPRESTPTAIPSSSFPEGTIFTYLAAGDSCTFAVTSEGLVYGWGMFRDGQGVLGFTEHVHVAYKPVLIPELKKIKTIACGANHALALDADGSVFAWGVGQQNQLGRRIVERTRLAGLTPREFSLPKKQIKFIAAGSDHSFAISKTGKVYSWGLNNFGQCGVADNAGEGEAVVSKPTIVAQLEPYDLELIKGGTHHSIAMTTAGVCLTWGRADGGQVGHDMSTIPDEDVTKNDRGQIGLLKKPTAIPGITGKFATTGGDQSFIINTAGRAYSWGFSTLYQTGLGTSEDVFVPTLIDNTATRERNLNWAGSGGQFSMLTAVAVPQTKVLPNGVGPAASSAQTATEQLPMVNGTASKTNGIKPSTKAASNGPNGIL